jgi:hypothetical protein
MKPANLWLLLGPLAAILVLSGGYLLLEYHEHLLRAPQCSKAAAAYWDFERRAAASREPLTDPVVKAGTAAESDLAQRARAACDGEIPSASFLQKQSP